MGLTSWKRKLVFNRRPGHGCCSSGSGVYRLPDGGSSQAAVPSAAGGSAAAVPASRVPRIFGTPTPTSPRLKPCWDAEADAKSAVADLLKAKPDLTVQAYRAVAATFSDNPVFVQQIASIAEGLRKAGLPEK